MALLLMEGFDNYKDKYELVDNVNYAPDPNFTDYGGIISTTYYRIGGQSLRMGNDYELRLNFPGSTATQWLNFVLYTTAYPTSTRQLLWAYDTDGAICWRLYITVAGKIEWRRGNTVVATSTISVPTNAWCNISTEHFINDTTGTITLKINGDTAISVTGVDTLSLTNTSCAAIEIRYAGSGYEYWDDIIFGDDSGSDLTAFPGDCHIEMLNPDADGTTNDWTPQGAGANYVEVDEAPASDDDTTYVSSSTATHKDLYGMAALTNVGDAYYAVQVRIRARKEAAGFRQFAATCRSNVTEVDGPSTGLATDWNVFDHIYENDPDGGGAWDEAAINAAQFGIELKT